MKYILSTLLFMMTITSTLSYHLPFAHRLAMSMSDNYLSKLQDQAKIPKQNDILHLAKTAQYTTEQQVNATAIYLNLLKFDSIVFKRNSRTIMFYMPRELNNLYYYNNSTLSKIPDSTKISSAGLKKFLMTEMPDDIDGLLF